MIRLHFHSLYRVRAARQARYVAVCERPRTIS